MTKRVLDVGQCDPDHGSIRRLIEDNFDAQVVRTHGLEDTLAELGGGAFQLVLINRKLDQDYSDGIDILRAIKTDDKFADLSVMLVTNFDAHQQEALDAGGERGFGKAELYHAETLERLAKILG